MVKDFQHIQEILLSSFSIISYDKIKNFYHQSY